MCVCVFVGVCAELAMATKNKKKTIKVDKGTNSLLRGHNILYRRSLRCYIEEVNKLSYFRAIALCDQSFIELDFHFNQFESVGNRVINLHVHAYAAVFTLKQLCYSSISYTRMCNTV